jgi:hypothetical protein
VKKKEKMKSNKKQIEKGEKAIKNENTEKAKKRHDTKMLQKQRKKLPPKYLAVPLTSLTSSFHEKSNQN